MGFRYRSRPDPHSGHGTRLVLRPRDDRLFLQAPVAHLRLPKVGRAVTTAAAPKPGANRRGERSADRVCAQPEELSQRRPGQADPGETRGAPGSGVHSVGPGAVRQLQAVARQAKPQNLSQAGRWQVLSLLRLLPGRRSGALLAAGADVVSFPAAILLQRPQLSGTTDEPAPSRVPCSGQRLRLHRRLRTGAEAGRRVWGREAAPQTGQLRRSLLPGGEAARAATLALNTTMRGYEIKQLCWRDVDLMERAVAVRKSKTEAGERVIPLNGDAWNAIVSLYRRSRAFGDVRPELYVFPACEHGSASKVEGKPSKGSSYFDPTRPQRSWRSAWRYLTA